MPVYTYKCPKCNYECDKLKEMSESDSKEICPKCGTEMKKIPSHFNFTI